MVNLSRLKKKIKINSKKLLKNILLSKVFHKGFYFLIMIVIITSALYGAYAMLNNQISDSVVVSESEIIKRVSKHIELPKEEPVSVTRVDNADSLKKQNSFYENVKNGEYILIYNNMAIIYDLLDDSIVAEK